jgi:mono/diheme cytochrome c family protein
MHPAMTSGARMLLPLVALAVAHAGCAGQDGGGRAEGTPDGAEVYADAGCASCHRLGGAGAAGPGSDLTRVGARRTVAELRRTLESPPSGMPAYDRRLSPAELDALARWLAGEGPP